MSDLDHSDNERFDRLVELRTAAVGSEAPVEGPLDDAPEEPDAYLRWFIDNDMEPTGSGPYGLADYCNQAVSYWTVRSEPNVHLFHYVDLWADRDGEMRRVAAALASTWTRADGRPSSRRPGSSRCEPAPATRLGGASGIGGRPSGSSVSVARATGRRSSTTAISRTSTSGWGRLAGHATDWVLRGRVALEADRP